MISVIIPVYNRVHTIRRAVDSVLKQSYQDFEIILVDDGSTDGSPEVCRNYAQQDKRIRFFCHKENRGVSAARNTGLRESSGQYIRFMDSDDELPEKSLEDLLEPFLEDSNLELVVACNGGDFPKTPDFSDRSVTKEEFLMLYLQPEFQCLYYSPCNSLYFGEVVEKNGLMFDETIRFGEDLIFNFRYYANVDKIYLLNRIVYQVHHPKGELHHLSNVQTQDIGERLRLAVIQSDIYRSVTMDLPDCRRSYSVICMDFMRSCMQRIEHTRDYPSFKSAVNSYDWENLFDEPDETYCWKYRFLYNGLRKKCAGRLFCFFYIKNRVYTHVPEKVRQVLRSVFNRCKRNLKLTAKGD